MSKIVVEREVVPVVEDSGSGTGSNVAWALAMVIIVAMIVGALYYSGVLRRLTNQPAQKVNVEVKTP
jgi:thiazole synthase ThiGH ThiG subunit